MEAVAISVGQMGLTNRGEVIFWDGSEGLRNVEGGKSTVSLHGSVLIVS